MRFPPSFIDEIRARLPVSEVVRARVKLQKSGREWKGLSPFNAERTPSFFVNDQKGFYHDFSSGNSGTIFDFVMATEGLSFPEAVERLAQQAGLALPSPSAAEHERERRRAGLHEVLDWAAAFFEASLARTEGVRARAYLASREIGVAAQRAFRLGYAPGGGSDDRHALRDHLAIKGASLATMIETGLLVHGEEIAVPYDRFRDRLMFPIHDRAGRVIAFGGRALNADTKPKYLNSPETGLFHKGSVLFNHHRARKAAHTTGALVVVEGYVDAIALSAAGFEHCVATLGTALTTQHCELVWQMAEEPVVCLDGDAAGRKAAHRLIDTALPLVAPGRTFRFALLPEGRDPDDLLRAEGAGAMAQVLEGAVPLADMVWSREWERAPLTTPEQRAGLEQRIAAVVAQIGDVALRRHYQENMARRLREAFGRTGSRNAASTSRPGSHAPRVLRGGHAGFRQLGPKLGVAAQPLIASAGLKQSAMLVSGRPATREVHILLLVLNHPDLLRRHADDLATTEFGTREFCRLRDVLIALDCDATLDHAGLKAAVDAAGLASTRQVLEAAGAGLSLWCARPDASATDAGAALAQALTLHHKTRSLHRELSQAVLDYIAAETLSNLARLNHLRAEISDPQGIEASLEGFGALSGRVGSDM